jgi:hypothetical protein
MFWGKRQFKGAEYGPYQDRLGDLQLANASRHREFMMVSTKVKAGLSDYYVGVPSKELMALFDGFEPVGEGELPKVVDSLVLADMDAFKESFKFRHELRRS